MYWKLKTFLSDYIPLYIKPLKAINPKADEKVEVYIHIYIFFNFCFTFHFKKLMEIGVISLILAI